VRWWRDGKEGWHGCSADEAKGVAFGLGGDRSTCVRLPTAYGRNVVAWCVGTWHSEAAVVRDEDDEVGHQWQQDTAGLKLRFTAS
jgi:hypothetical protein